jgi:hypothetical protein
MTKGLVDPVHVWPGFFDLTQDLRREIRHKRSFVLVEPETDDSKGKIYKEVVASYMRLLSKKVY